MTATYTFEVFSSLDGYAAASGDRAADFDLELLGSRTLDGHIQELIYRPALHRPVLT